MARLARASFGGPAPIELTSAGNGLIAVHTFTSAVIQASVILHAPEFLLAQEIKQDLEASFAVLKGMTPSSLLAQQPLPILDKLRHSLFAAASPASLTILP